MNIRTAVLLFFASFLLSHGSYAQDDIESIVSDAPYFNSLKKALRNKKEAYKLDLSNSSLKEFPLEILKLSELRYLLLDSNQISSIPETIDSLKKLEAFSISHNEIQAIPSTIGNFQQLYYLNVGSNKINGLPSELFLIPGLELLYINNNNLSAFPADFKKLKELRHLYASNNKIEHIPNEIGHLYNLRTLSLANNRLKDLPDKFFELSKLESLYLYENQFDSLDERIQKLEQLKKLHLAKNKLKRLPPTIGTLYHLTELYLYNNELESIPLETNSFINLATLNIDHNSFTTLPADLAQLNHLKIISLEGNIFTPFPQVLYDLQNKGVEIHGLKTKELYTVKLLSSKAKNKKLTGKYDEAIKNYKEILKLDTNNVRVMYELASSQLEQGQFELARAMCEKALLKKPGSELSKEINGVYDKCLTKTNRYTALNQEYEERYKKNPSDVTPYFELGKKYFDLKKYNESLTYFQKAIEQDPLFQDAHFYIAIVSLIQKKDTLFIFSTLRYLMLEQNGNKAKTILPFLFSKMKMKTGVRGKKGNLTYYDSYVIKDDNGEVIYKSEDATSDLLIAMISDLTIDKIVMADTEESDSSLVKSIENAFNTNKNNVERFQEELTNICSSKKNEAGGKENILIEYYSPFYDDLVEEEQVETLAYFINSIKGLRGVDEDFIDKWLNNNPDKVDALKQWSTNYKWETK